MVRFFIFAGILIGVAIVLWIFLVFIPSQKDKTDVPVNCKTPEGENGIIVNGVCEPQGKPTNPNVLPDPTGTGLQFPLSFKSTKINGSDVTPAQSPSVFFNDIPLGNVSGYNVLTSPLTGILQYIHFETPFSSNCDSYVWYKNALYVLRGSETTQGGVKTCYYEYKRSVFPATIRINTLQPPCTVFNYYIGDVRYQYKEVVTQGVTLGSPKYYCIYEKK